ncbi:unnamed protein product [Candidula unifasciata]|uniref:Transcription factor Adf-1 n=1 Tax=Candidula unifasciata TaxID=100452 RepID=A0A8S3Z9D2_9EUPU|nr:unnamed protein product [Candidula unifasciata]
MEDEQLIQSVQKASLLYDKSDPMYGSRESTQKAWTEVAADLKEPIDVVKKRWTCLRDYFRRQQKNFETLKPEEWSAKKKKWPLYESMTFLLPYMEFSNTTLTADGVLETHQSLDSGDDVSEESVSVTFDNQILESARRQQNMFLCQSKRKRTVNDLDHQFFSAPNGQHHEEDDHEHFLKSLLPMMRTLDSLAAMEFRHEVQGLLIKYIKKAHVQDMPSQSVDTLP